MTDFKKNRKLYYGAILAAFGTIMIANLSNPVGVVFVAIGGLYFIYGMRDFKKNKDDKK